MAVELLRGEESHDDFMERLFTSRTIEISFSQQEETTSFPGVLACAASKPFLTLCGSSSPPSFNVYALGKNHYESWTYLNRMTIGHFSRWLYTPKLPAEPLGLFFDIWNFGSILKSPKFENAVIRAFSAVVSKFNAKEDVSNQRELEFASSGMIEDKLDAAWERADFSPNHDMDLDRTKGEVFWGNKKILLSIFDAAAWLGMDSTGVANIIRAGGEQAVILHTREMLVASGEVHGPPWAAENI